MEWHEIAILRKQRGMSQKDLAKIIGISEDYLSKIETGKRTPAKKTLARIASALGVSTK